MLLLLFTVNTEIANKSTLFEKDLGLCSIGNKDPWCTIM